MVHIYLSDFFFELSGGVYVGFVHGLVVLVSLFGSPGGWVSCSTPGVKSVTRYKLSDPAFSGLTWILYTRRCWLAGFIPLASPLFGFAIICIKNIHKTTITALTVTPLPISTLCAKQNELLYDEIHHHPPHHGISHVLLFRRTHDPPNERPTEMYVRGGTRRYQIKYRL